MPCVELYIIFDGVITVVLCVKNLGMLPLSRQTNKHKFTPCFGKWAAIYAKFGASGQYGRVDGVIDF